MRSPSPARPAPVSLIAARAAQQNWSAAGVRTRLKVIRQLRALVAEDPLSLARTIPLHVPGSLHRTLADTLVAEVLPLAEACRWLVREAPRILAPERLSRSSRPVWLRSVEATVRRDPHGVVLVVGPANYPLFLPGVQALQALAAGNAVLWKPAPAGAIAARALKYLLLEAGLEDALFTVLDTAPVSVEQAIAAGVDKVVVTGHVDTGRAILRQCAEAVIPATVELSGCDAVFVLPGANLRRTAEALAFGLRLNGSATCMAPRRLFVANQVADALLAMLRERLQSMPAVALAAGQSQKLAAIFDDAAACGAELVCEGSLEKLRYALILGATPEMRAMESDVAAPVLSVSRYVNLDAALEAHAACPYALTTAVFGPEHEASALAGRLRAGTVLVNDLIVSTADPRLAFGGRGKSGFGLTRGREGLLEMTVQKTVLVQRGRSLRPFAPTGEAHERFFAAFLQATHGGTWKACAGGLRRLLQAGKNLG